MLRAALLMALLGLALAAPAASAALAPPPTVLDFEAFPAGDARRRGLRRRRGDAERAVADRDGRSAAARSGLAVAAPLVCADVTSPGHDSERSLDVFGGGELIHVRRAAGERVDVGLVVLERDRRGVVRARRSSSTLIERLAADHRTRARSAAPPCCSRRSGAPTSAPCACFARRAPDVSVDDITFSPVAQPDTEIVSGPGRGVALHRRELRLRRQPGRHPLRLLARRRRRVPCRPPYALSGLAAGAHTLTVAMRDRFGTPDPTPAVWTWTVDLSPVAGARAAPPAADGDGDGVPGRARQLPVGGQRVAGRRRRRRRGGRVRGRPRPATSPPVTGERVVATVLSGDVFIKLPAPRGRFKQAPLSGFVPLKGQAALPIGTVVDTRKGRLSMASTVDGRRIGSGGRTQTAILSAGIFQIRQRKAALGSTAQISTDLVLQSAPGAEASCVSTGRLRADQGPRAQHGARPDGDDREGPVPDRRRGGHQHRDRRDVGDQGPLRRHPHRRRQGHA